MRVVAYCTLPAAQAVRKATGIKPLTSPPLVAANVPTKALVADVLYFRLHGTETNTDVWFGDDGKGHKPLALRLKQIYKLKLDGAVVILANCYGSDSPFVPAFYRAGARAVIAGPGENYSGVSEVIGADLLASMVIKSLKRGHDLERATKTARLRLSLTRWKRRKNDTGEIVYPNKDTLEFQIIKNKWEA